MGKHLFAAIFLAASAAAQPNLSGVWEWDKSLGTHKPGEPENFRVKIDQQGNNITITMRVNARVQVEQNTHRLVAGQETKGEIHGSPMTSRGCFAPYARRHNVWTRASSSSSANGLMR